MTLIKQKQQALTNKDVGDFRSHENKIKQTASSTDLQPISNV